MRAMVTHTPGVMGGSAVIRDTRIPVWLLVRMGQLGMCDADILEQYPGLTQMDMRSAKAYFREHPAEIDRDIVENESA